MQWISGESVLPDVSISRPTSRVHWAIPVPPMHHHLTTSSSKQEFSPELSPQQSVYVWLDAIVNYLTVAGYPDIHSNKFQATWPPNIHVIGKDILK